MKNFNHLPKLTIVKSIVSTLDSTSKNQEFATLISFAKYATLISF